MPTENISIIDPDQGSGWNYSSLNAWESDWGGLASGDLVALDKIAIAKCRCTGGTADVTAVTIDGWTTSATQYIQIWTDPAESYRHNGTYQTGNKYRLTNTIGLFEEYIRLDGLQISADGNLTDIYYSGTGHTYITNCILVQTAIDGTKRAIYFEANANAILYAYNNIIYGFVGSQSGHRAVEQMSGTMYCYSTTAIGGYYGILVNGGTAVIKNCYAGGTSGGLDYYGGTKTTCASSDTTGSTGLQSIAVNITNFTNITVGTENFHLPGTGSALYNVGTDTSGDAAPMNFTTDIDGQTRTGTWDIGADEYIVAVTGILRQMMAHHE